jgi:hypothetical protein
MFKTINFLAILSMHVCPVASYRRLVFNETFHWILIIYFINKSYGSNLRVNSQLNGKSSTHRE